MIQTERLELREYSIKDAPFIFNLMNTEGWLKNIGDRNIKTIQDAQAYIQKHYLTSYVENGFGPYLVSLKDGTPIGSSGLYKRAVLDYPDIGFAFLPAFTNKGYAYEASKAVMQYATENLGLKTILGITLHTNLPSIKLLKKHGLSEVGIYTDEKGEELLLFSTEHEPKYLVVKNPVLLLHGALGSSEQLLPLKQELSKFHEVYTFTFDGHGHNTIEEDFSIALFTENTVNFLAEKKITKAHIFGYSMGGYVALHLALKHPALVEKIVTLGTKFDWTPTFAQKEIKMLNPEIIELKVPVFADQLKKLHGNDNWKNVVLKTAKMMADLGENPNLKATDYKNIYQPTLICLGALDTMATAEESIYVSNWLPNGKFQEIENLKHPIEGVLTATIGNIINNFIGNGSLK